MQPCTDRENRGEFFEIWNSVTLKFKQNVQFHMQILKIKEKIKAIVDVNKIKFIPRDNWTFERSKKHFGNA